MLNNNNNAYSKIKWPIITYFLIMKLNIVVLGLGDAKELSMHF